MTMRLEIRVNGQSRPVDTAPDRPLLHVLREDLGLTGTKYGCGEGACGACTVLLDSKPIRSCITLVSEVGQRSILTVEGLAEGDALHPVQEAFAKEGVLQCGYCGPGMILATVALLDDTPRPTDEQIIGALNGNLCRCCAYPAILEAVHDAARRMEVGGA